MTAHRTRTRRAAAPLAAAVLLLAVLAGSAPAGQDPYGPVEAGPARAESQVQHALRAHHRARRSLVPPVLREGQGDRRADLQARVQDRDLVSGHGALDGPRDPRREQRLSGHLPRQEPPVRAHGAVRGVLVVPQGVHRAGRPRPDPDAARVRRHQLPGQHLAQREEGGRRGHRLRRLPALFHRRDGGRQEDGEERPGRRGHPAEEGRADDRLGRLEPGPARQRHGPLPRRPGAGHGRRLDREPLRRDQA